MLDSLESPPPPDKIENLFCIYSDCICLLYSNKLGDLKHEEKIYCNVDILYTFFFTWKSLYGWCEAKLGCIIP